MIELIANFWPFILSGVGVCWGLIANHQKNEAEADNKFLKKEVEHEKFIRRAQTRQVDALRENNKIAEDMLREAHEEDSISNLTNDSY